MLEDYKKLLSQFITFKSISTHTQYDNEMGKVVVWLKNLFTARNFSTKILKGKLSNPVVFASYKFNDRLPTVLIYGHYDVQPASISDGWQTEPFKMAERKRKIFGRGIVDNKGQILIHIASVFALIRQKSLGYNIKFLIEGNEETGNEDLPSIMVKNRNLLKCDFVLVSDGELTNNKPTIEISLRGGFNCTLTYISGKNNLHSGLAGGAVPNSAIELSKFIAKLYKPDGSISYKNFYKDIDKVDADQLENNKSLQKESGDIAKLMGVESLLMPKGVDFFTQTGLSSTIQVTGFKSGYIDSGYSNIVPAAAEVRLNFRLAPSQNLSKVIRIFERFVKANTPSYIKYKLVFSGPHNPVRLNTNNKFLISAEKVLTAVYKTKVNRRNVGGAIPFVGDVKRILGVDALLIPLVNEDCNMHGTDENFDIDLIKKGLNFSQKFLSGR